MATVPTTMSLKQEIETWVAALARYDNNEFDDALAEFDKISDTSKILFNMGVIHATLGEHEKAVECYQRAIRCDQYLAVAYFQQGVSNFLIGDFEEALVNFNDTLLYLRGNNTIDYYQLGLLFKLYSCEVLFNRGLCYIYLEQKELGMQDLGYALKEKIVEDHNVIDEAIAEQAEGYTVFSIPVGVVYRPNEAKVRNLKTKDYLGKARLVAASDRSNLSTGFAGSENKNSQRQDYRELQPSAISFTASHLVKPGLTSRREQSEPPTNRTMFPPTPPPEVEKPTREGSIRSNRPAPGKLTIQTQDANRRYEKAASPPDSRPRPTRSASAAPTSLPLRQMSSRSTLDETSPEEPFDPFQARNSYSSRGSRTDRTGRSRHQQPEYIEEEAEPSDGSPVIEDDFEMVADSRHPPSTLSSSSRGTSRRPDVRKIRFKVHASDVRYIMTSAAVEFPEVEERVRDKFMIQGRFKIKVKDEDMPDGDMITVGDQDDLEMVIQSAKTLAMRKRLDTAKIEIWIFTA